MIRRANAALAVMLFGSPTLAEEGHSFRLVFTAPGDCPTAEAFSRGIESNSSRARPALAGEPAIAIDASIASEGAGFIGVLDIRRLDGTQARRVVPAATCSEAASALALIAAIAVDPDARAPASQTDALAEPKGAAPSPPVTNAPPAASTPAAPIEPPAPLPATVSSPAPRATRPRSFWIGVNVGAGIMSGMAPEVSPDFGLGLGVGSKRKGLFSPVILVSGHLAESLDFQTSEGTAQFQRLAARLTGCPLAREVGPILLRPCLHFEIGQLRAQGSHVASSPTVRKTLWLDLGVSARGEMTLIGPLLLAVDVGAIFPLVSDSFYFEPSQVPFFEIPPVGFVGALELGLRFL